MWQPRGLNYPLYSVLSRHHSEGNNFSLSFLQRQEEAAQNATPLAPTVPSAAADAGDGVSKLPRHVLLRGGASTDGGGVPEPVDVATDIAIQCRPSASSPRRALVLQDEGESEAQAAFLQGGAPSGHDTFNESGARGSAENLHAAAASPRDAQAEEEPHKQHAQRPDKRGKAREHQEEMQQHQQKRQGDQRKQARHQQQTQAQQGQGEQQDKGERQPQKEQREQQEGQQQGVQDQQQNGKHFRGSSQHSPVTSDSRTAVSGQNRASDPRRGSSAELKCRCGAAAPGDAKGRRVEGRDTCEQTMAAPSASSLVSRLCSPTARPPPLSSPSVQDNTSTSQSSLSANSLHVPRECGDACIIPSPVSGIPVYAVPAASAALAASGGARGSFGETLSRLPSLRQPVVPSLRVLILFGSTSGVSAAVAFSIFHTLVHRLLSSSKLMHGGCIQDRAVVSAVSPLAVSAREAAADRGAGSPDEETPSVSATPVALFSSPVAAGRGEHALGNSPSSRVSETGERRGTADARSQTSSCVSMESEAFFPKCELLQKSSGEQEEEFPARNGAEGSKYFNCATGAGKGPNGEDSLPEGEEIQQRVQQQRNHQHECDGKDQRRSHEEQKEKGHTREEWHSERQRQHVCQRNGQQQTQQQNQQQRPQQNSGASHRQSAYLEEGRSPASVRSVFPVKREFISEKREAAAQAAEVASMGLKAAAAIASAALKVGEQHDALRRAAATACETRDDCEEEPKIWFLDEIQIGRVGVFIQSMQYLTLQDFLEFVEESRAASAAATAAATREGADTCAAVQMNCSAEAETVVVDAFAGALDAQELSKTQLGEVVAEAGARDCACGNTPTNVPTKNADHGNFGGSASPLGTSGCCTSTTSSVAAGAVTAGGSGTTTEVLTSIPHTLVLYCISTDTGGAPPESAAPFFSELLEAADDFRVSRGSLQGCCVAGVGCGSTDYPHSTFCKPARQLMIPLQRLGAQALMQQPLLLLTDTSAAATTEMKLAKWRQHLMQQVECLLQASSEEDVQRLLHNAKGTVSSREKQQREHRRQQQQQQRSSSSLKDDHEACGGVTEGPGTRAVEDSSRKPADAQRSQGCGLPAVNEVFKRDGSVLQESMLDFGAVTDSSLESDSGEQSASDDDSSIFDEDEGFAVDEASPLPVSKRFNSNSEKSKFFAGVGSAVCGGSGGEDVEDVVGGEASDEGAEHNTGSMSLPQVKWLQADRAELSNRRREDRPGAETANLASQSYRRDSPKRALRAGGPTCADEGRERHQRGRGRRHVERTREKMVKPRHAEQLSKEGYRLIGSHSAVKLCRWTKSQLRGRGGCYKHTFYGITSSQCMEMTPSLACANKCVFCWRHHKNPVGTSWRWQMDDETFVVEEAITQHFKAIKELKGMAEVKQDRLDAARTNIRHCALSLVGEPIMYPRIAALVKLLHEKHISTFMLVKSLLFRAYIEVFGAATVLRQAYRSSDPVACTLSALTRRIGLEVRFLQVTNAQFPEALASLPPVTQLYLSVDAASPETLKAVGVAASLGSRKRVQGVGVYEFDAAGLCAHTFLLQPPLPSFLPAFLECLSSKPAGPHQPLFKDYWERFTKCMDILRSKRQRTVYRLTLVAGYNMPDLTALEQTPSEVPSEAHHDGRQQTDTTTPRPPSSEDPPECHLLSTKRAALEKAERGLDDPASHAGCACGDAAACVGRSAADAPRAAPPPSTSSAPSSGLNQEVETEGRGKGHSLTVKRGGGEDMRGRSPAAYAALVLKGLPDFIEVKAATYAGTSKHSKITMKNIPWHDQVVAFCKDLCAALPKGDYELACVHRHSCCVLIAKTEYKKNDKWHTWIDYEKFHELAASGRTDFAGTDYCAPTPDWATFGHIAAGFSPHEARIYTKGKQKRLQGSASVAGACHV